jgi:hypothetical protein
MHYFGIILSGENESRTTHIGSQLIYVIDSTNCMESDRRISEVSAYEGVSHCWSEFGQLLVRSADPKPFLLQSSYQMRANEPARTTD